MDRLIRITRPNGAQTTYQYMDPYWTIVYQDQNAPGDKALQTQSVYDGLGRVIEQRIMEGSTGDLIATDTGYDALGRLWWTANPSRVIISTWTPDGLAYQTWTRASRI